MMRTQFLLCVACVGVLFGCSDAAPANDADAGKKHDGGSAGSAGTSGASGASGVNAGNARADAASLTGDAEVDAGRANAIDGGSGGGAGAGAPELACNGDFNLQTAADVAAIAKCTTIHGGVFAFSTTLTTISLPVLESVTEAFRLEGNPNLTTLDLPQLATVGGNLSVDESALTALTLPKLTAFGPNFSIQANMMLTSLKLPALVTFSGKLSVSNDLAMQTLSLPALTEVTGTLAIQGISVPDLVVPKLASANEFGIDYNRGMTSVSFPALTSVGALFGVYDNPELTSLSFPLLTKVTGSFTISSNFTLPTCQAQTLLDQLVAAPSMNTISDNLGTCPP